MSTLVDEVAQAHDAADLLEVAERAYGYEEKARGAIFTKPAVVDFMLDLVGYTVDKPLHRMRLLEPSFGGGRFVLHAVDRLIETWKRDDGSEPLELRDALCAVELDAKTFENLGQTLQQYLMRSGFPVADSKLLADSWPRHEDFLLGEPLGEFDFVIGNPPYVRQELVPNDLLQIYRAKYPTMVGRADLYIAFIERSLDLLPRPANSASSVPMHGPVTTMDEASARRSRRTTPSRTTSICTVSVSLRYRSGPTHLSP